MSSRRISPATDWRRRKFLGGYYEAWLWTALYFAGFVVGKWFW